MAKPIVAIAILTALASPAALAQGSAPPVATAPSATPTEGISRDDYIAKARAAAEQRAAKRFDTMDANHDGVLTQDEIAAYRAAHPRRKRTEQNQ